MAGHADLRRVLAGDSHVPAGEPRGPGADVALPKGGREREVPLPEAAAVTLSETLRHWSVVDFTLPWEDQGGEPVTETLVFTEPDGGAIVRSASVDRARAAIDAAYGSVAESSRSDIDA